MRTSIDRPKTTINHRKAESLLFPLAMFLGIGGLTKKDAEACFSKAYDRALAKARRLRIEHIGLPTPYGDVVGIWTKDRRFVDSSGRPRTLRLRGKNSIATLIKKAHLELTPKQVISIFQRYGNVRRVPGEGYELVNPFFASNARKNVAFEPIASFLADASLTLERILNYRGKAQSLRYFWRKVESVNLSEALARQFSAFSQERSLAFLEELDDWLDAHSNRERKPNRPRRVGIGVFSIYSSINSNSLTTSKG